MFGRSSSLLRCRAHMPQRAGLRCPRRSITTSRVVYTSEELPVTQEEPDTNGVVGQENPTEDVVGDVFENTEDVAREGQIEQDEDEGSGIETYREFKEKFGSQFEKANKPNQWLGGKIPFPMNKSFRPPPPLSNVLRETIWQLYVKNPVDNNVRILAKKFHLSIGRVDAILRLKGMEKDWTKDIPLQTGFLAGMEYLLNVNNSSHRLRTRHMTSESDEIEEIPGRQAARDRYERLYWETADEASESLVLPSALENAQARAKQLTEAKKVKPDDPRIKPRVPIPSYVLNPHPIQRVHQPGRPDLKFVDVGNTFVDDGVLLARYKESERKARLRRDNKRRKVVAK